MATAKPKKPPVLDIKRELSAVDLKNYNFYDSLTPEEKKAFSPFVLMRFTSSVQGDRDIQEWFLEMTNEILVELNEVTLTSSNFSNATNIQKARWDSRSRIL